MAIADGAFFPGTTKEYDRPENYGLRFEDVLIPSTDGVALHGWVLWADEAVEPVGTVVHCHGNAGNISAHFRFVSWLPCCGWNVLCFDYRGYGRSSGRPVRRGVIDDTHAALRYAGGRDDLLPDRQCVIGQSLGAAVTIVALAEGGHHPRGVILDGPFSGYQAAARFVTSRKWYTWGVSRWISRWWVSDDYAPIEFAARMPEVPKLFICGDRDGIVDYRQTVALHDAASEPKELWVIKDSGHTEAMTEHVEGGAERVLRFLHGCLQVPGGGAATSGQ